MMQQKGNVGKHMGVSKNRGTPKWMVKIMENPIKHGMIWGVNIPIFGLTPTCCSEMSSDLATWRFDLEMIKLLHLPIRMGFSRILKTRF